MSKTKTEEAIQAEIVQFLNLEGWYVIQYAKPGTHGRLRGAVASGHPDLLAIKGGQCCWFEVKRPGGRLSPAQKTMHENLVTLACRVYTVTCVEDCAVALSAWGFQVRTKFTRHENEPGEL